MVYETSCVIPNSWISLKLVKITPYNHDTSLFEFALPSPTSSLSLPVCSSLNFCAPGKEHDGADAIRSYTSISSPEVLGKFQVICKRYDEWGDPRYEHSFKPAGVVSNYIHSLKVGDYGLFKHVSQSVRIPYPFKGVKTITMLAVGAGIASQYQCLQNILAKDEIQITLIYGTRTVADILLYEQLEEWGKKYSQKFRVIYTIGSRWAKVHMHEMTCPPRCKIVHPPPLPDNFKTLPSDRRELGWIDQSTIKKHAFPPSDCTRVFVCGLPGVYDMICGPRDKPEIEVGSALWALKYTKDMVVKF